MLTQLIDMQRKRRYPQNPAESPGSLPLGIPGNHTPRTHHDTQQLPSRLIPGRASVPVIDRTVRESALVHSRVETRYR